jgi:hypothetical protein
MDTSTDLYTSGVNGRIGPFRCCEINDCVVPQHIEGVCGCATIGQIVDTRTRTTTPHTLGQVPASGRAIKQLISTGKDE